VGALILYYIIMHRQLYGKYIFVPRAEVKFSLTLITGKLPGLEAALYVAVQHI